MIDKLDNTDGTIENPNIFDDVALAIIREGISAKTEALAKNPTISPFVIQHLFGLHPDLIMSNPAFAAAISSDEEFPSKIFRAHSSVIPQMKLLDFSWFGWLLEHPDKDIRQFTASNPCLPSNLHQFCLLSPDPEKRIGLAQNTGVPPEIIATLCKDKNPRVRAKARSNPIRPGQIILNTKASDLVDAKSTKVKSGFVPNQSDEEINSSADKSHNSLLKATNNTSPALFWTVALGLALISLVLGLLLADSRNRETGRLPPINEGTYGNYIADALVIASNNSMRAKQNPTKEQWRSIAEDWRKAIEMLEKIPAGSSLRAVAQDRVKLYRGILAVAEKNAN